MNIERFKKWYFIVPAVIVAAPVIIAIFAFVGGGVVMLLWNWLLPPLFGWPEISLLQGFGLLALTRILFGGLSGRGGGPGAGRRGMTVEQRERFRRRMCARPDEAGGAPTTVE
jgi:hypothetical protein